MPSNVFKSRTMVKLAGLFLAIASVVAFASSASASPARPAAISGHPKYTVTPVKNPNTGAVSSVLVPAKTPAEVVARHLKALNACNWKGLMAQYPDQVEIYLPGGTVEKGRKAVGDLFAGFVLPAKKGGLCGIKFSTLSSKIVNGTTVIVKWVARASFLVKPYEGTDAYFTDCGLLVDQVSTFNSADLKMKK